MGHLKSYYETKLGKLYHGDCLEIMPKLESKFDLILSDPPYGVTNCNWDSIIPLDIMWKEIKRIIKPRTPIIITGTQPFTTMLISSNIKWFRHCWIWKKTRGTNFILAKKQPLKITEDIIVFGSRGVNYYPIMVDRKKPIKAYRSKQTSNLIALKKKDIDEIKIYNKAYPKNIIEVKSVCHQKRFHPTEKPIALMSYLINTYTMWNDMVLDFTAGSGTTGLACEQLKRRWIMIEKDERYCEISAKRIEQENKQLELF